MSDRISLLRLTDGRMMEFAEYGDPEGDPLFFFHGFIGSHHQAMLADKAARTQGIRIIAANRPGIGRSSPSKFRTMTEYAADILELADALHIDTFGVIGASGGGCFALATAYVAPDRVRIVGVFGAIGPMNILYNVQQLRWLRRLFLQGCHGYPVTAQFLLSGFIAYCRNYPQTFYRMLLRSSDLGEHLLWRSDIQRILWSDYQSVFLQPGGSRGLLLEACLYFHWGFNLHDFPGDIRVLFWHGRDDSVVPLSCLRRIVRPIPRSQAILCPGGHLSFLMSDPSMVLKTIKQEWHAASEWSESEEFTHEPVFDAVRYPAIS